ncbi:HD domain-containing protein [Rhodohalobacter sp. 8-1]|uniref:HD domain-containing protein n=1 Tax=Rhodohalobacter sp. 8-1 TaxID=3131972 RepID=UPI0030EDD088
MSEEVYRKFLEDNTESDAAHDIAHVKRVVKNAELIFLKESADKEIVLAAAWLHDCAILPKNHPDRKRASTFAAQKAAQFLATIDFPENKIASTAHAIEAHSYSAGIIPKTIEAKIVQDADRLDALGAIGIARCFSVGGELNNPMYHPDDPFAENREPDDTIWTVDHFYQKLFRLPDMLNTKTAKEVASKRVEYMKSFLQQVSAEIG